MVGANHASSRKKKLFKASVLKVKTAKTSRVVLCPNISLVTTVSADFTDMYSFAQLFQQSGYLLRAMVCVQPDWKLVHVARIQISFCSLFLSFTPYSCWLSLLFFCHAKVEYQAR